EVLSLDPAWRDLDTLPLLNRISQSRIQACPVPIIGVRPSSDVPAGHPKGKAIEHGPTCAHRPEARERRPGAEPGSKEGEQNQQDSRASHRWRLALQIAGDRDGYKAGMLPGVPMIPRRNLDATGWAAASAMRVVVVARSLR